MRTARLLPGSGLPGRLADDPPVDPVPLAELLGEALPPRLRRRLLDLDFFRALWDRAAPPDLRDQATPTRFERKVLTLAAADHRTRSEAHSRRGDLARLLTRAAGLPDTALRVRVELDAPGARPPRRGAR